MADVPWYVENHRVFLLLILLSFGAMVLDAGTYEGEDPFDEGDPMFLAVVIIFAASYRYYKTFQRFHEVVEALGDKLSTVEVIQPMWHTSIHCTTHDGREFFLYYHGGWRRYWDQPYYELWIELNTIPGRIDSYMYEREIRHLTGIRSEPKGDEGGWRLIARLSDEWLTSETPDILKSLDALNEIKET